MKVLVCGPRDWGSKSTVSQVSKRLDALRDDELVIIHGNARGVDRIAMLWATMNSVREHPFPADCHTYGKAAGPIRNQNMLDFGKPDLVIAFQPKGSKTPGTQDMIRRARAAKVPTEVIEV